MRGGRLVGKVLSASVLALLAALGLLAGASAQPEPQGTVLALRPPAEQPVDVGDEVRVELVIENVEHLAAFDALIIFDWQKLEWTGGEVGRFFLDGPREELCQASPLAEVEYRGPKAEIDRIVERLQSMKLEVLGPNEQGDASLVTVRVEPDQMGGALDLGSVDKTSVFFNCITINLPVPEGPPGVDGSGTLGVLTFRAKKGGDTTLEFDEIHTLVADRFDDEGNLPPIQHTVQGATVKIKGSNSFPWLLVIVIIVVVAAVAVAAGGAGYWWYRRRPAPPTPPAGDA